MKCAAQKALETEALTRMSEDCNILPDHHQRAATRRTPNLQSSLTDLHEGSNNECQFGQYFCLQSDCLVTQI